jgi:ornithine--oxo-acid transaminase
MATNKFIAMEERYGARNYHPLDVVLTKGQGVWVFDCDGNRYLDFLSAYSALNQGHCHPKIVAAAKGQLDRLTLTSRAFYNDQLGRLLERLVSLTGLEMVLPMNSGAEGVETALKAARKWGYTIKGVDADKAEVIVCANNFAGRTITIVSFTTEQQYKEGFGPFTPGFTIIPYNDIDALQKAITPNTVAFLAEPIQGEGGIIVPDEGYLQNCQKICRENNVLFMLDEIQTGLGRTGKLFAFQYESGVLPDVLIMGKALAGGLYPVSAVASRKDVLGVFNPGDHGSTFGGNPLGSAIACAALDVIVDDKLSQRSMEMGGYFMDKLRTIKSDYIKEIRGKGLLIGIELVSSAGGARRFCEALKQEGMLCKETHENVIRFAPPLVIKKEDIDWAVERVEKVLATI